MKRRRFDDAGEGVDLTVQGQSCAVRRTIAAVDGELIPLSHDATLLVDRFDARALLDAVALRAAAPSRRQRREAAALLPREANGDACEAERWWALQAPAAVIDGVEDADDVLASPKTAAFAWSYANVSDTATSAATDAVSSAAAAEPSIIAEAVEAEVVTPRYSMLPLPAAIPAVPLKAHKLMEATARRAATQPQLEVMLRMRESSHAEFAFLNEGTSQHPYYAHLKLRAACIDADWPDPCANDVNAPQVRRPLVSYDSSSDSESDAAEVASVQRELKSTVAAPQTPPTAVVDVMHKFLQYVRKNGTRFVALVAAKEKENPKFAFLQGWSPYHAYWAAQLASQVSESAAAAPQEHVSVADAVPHPAAPVVAEMDPSTLQEAVPVATVPPAAAPVKKARRERTQPAPIEYITEWVVDASVTTPSATVACLQAVDEPSFDVDSDVAIDTEEGFSYYDTAAAAEPEAAATNSGDTSADTVAATVAAPEAPPQRRKRRFD